MITLSIFPGRYLQGAGATRELGREMARFGRHSFVVCGPHVHDAVLPGFRGVIEQESEARIERFGGECSDEELARLLTMAGAGPCDVVVGIGGGKTMDMAKIVADEIRRPVVIVPTIASTDAPCSAVAVVYTMDGVFKRVRYLAANPNVVLVDTEIIAHAPVRLLVAGMGDALATWFEAESCRRKYAPNEAGRPGTMTAYALARLCYDTLLEYGLQAKTACDAQVVTPAFERVVEANTLLSGLGFESGGLAAAHSIHNGLTALAQTHRFYHGEKVAIGTLASLFLSVYPARLVDEVFAFCEAVGLPTTLAAVGLSSVTDEELLCVGRRACAENECIHHEPAPVSPERVVAALKMMDAEGRRRAA